MTDNERAKGLWAFLLGYGFREEDARRIADVYNKDGLAAAIQCVEHKDTVDRCITGYLCVGLHAFRHDTIGRGRDHKWTKADVWGET